MKQPQQQQFKGLINYKPLVSSNHDNENFQTTNHAEDNKQRIEFVHHKLNKHLLQQDDLVLIVVPEEFEILQVIDPMLHGKVGHIASLSNDLDDETVSISLGSPSLRKSNNGDLVVHSSNNNNNSSMVTVPKFCVCLKADVFNERKEKFMSQRRTKSHETLSTEHYQVSRSSVSTATSSSESNARNGTSCSSSPTTTTPSTTTTTTTIMTTTPMYSMGPKIPFNLQNRQKRGTSSATTPIFNHSPTSFLHSSTTTGAVGQISSSSSTHRRLSSASTNSSSCFHSPYSSPNKLQPKQTSPKRSSKQQQFFMDESDDCKGLAGSVPKFINSYMLTDTEMPNVYSADIPNNKTMRDDMDLDSFNEIIGTTVFTHKRERVS
ncbi:hypothetical protein C9374_003081 [Naegleria lovaniensis]|uniref:Uncharacterized protein n=1 Tax=Naegleria lovaniensis TaxID=51637 RepID=A0AA88KQ05_NAELO|nr:uncharacterized protein C9374_003081 [Naegleria lovaniensis]KAG2385932.1 hypothetical protein C9374_003081 [Naegleria lovaniensis]